MSHQINGSRLPDTDTHADPVDTFATELHARTPDGEERINAIGMPTSVVKVLTPENVGMLAHMSKPSPKMEIVMDRVRAGIVSSITPMDRSYMEPVSQLTAKLNANKEVAKNSSPIDAETKMAIEKILDMVDGLDLISEQVKGIAKMDLQHFLVFRNAKDGKLPKVTNLTTEKKVRRIGKEGNNPYCIEHIAILNEKPTRSLHGYTVVLPGTNNIFVNIERDSQ